MSDCFEGPRACIGGSFQLPDDGFIRINGNGHQDVVCKSRAISISAQNDDFVSRFFESQNNSNKPPQAGAVTSQIPQAIVPRRCIEQFSTPPSWRQVLPQVLRGIGARWGNEPLPADSSRLVELVAPRTREDLWELLKLSTRPKMLEILFWGSGKLQTSMGPSPHKTETFEIPRSISHHLPHLENTRIYSRFTPQPRPSTERLYSRLTYTCFAKAKDDNESITEYSSDESVDSESTWTSGYSEAIPELKHGHTYLSIKSEVVRETLEAFLAFLSRRGDGHTRTIANGQSGTNPEASYMEGSSLTSGNSGAGEANKRRGRGRGSSSRGRKEDDEDGTNPPPKKRARRAKPSGSKKLCFACPFAKKDPAKYVHCNSHTITRVRDVKLHLTRHHWGLIYCPRCKTRFRDIPERQEHAESSVPCVARCDIQVEEITKSQMKQLSQTMPQGWSDEEKWFAMFDIVCPGHTPRPTSVYKDVNLTKYQQAFKDFMDIEGATIMLTYINERNLQLVNTSGGEPASSSFQREILYEGLQRISQECDAKIGALVLEHPDDGNIEPSDPTPPFQSTAAFGRSPTSSDTLGVGDWTTQPSRVQPDSTTGTSTPNFPDTTTGSKDLPQELVVLPSPMASQPSQARLTRDDGAASNRKTPTPGSDYAEEDDNNFNPHPAGVTVPSNPEIRHDETFSNEFIYDVDAAYQNVLL